MSEGEKPQTQAEKLDEALDLAVGIVREVDNTLPRIREAMRIVRKRATEMVKALRARELAIHGSKQRLCRSIVKIHQEGGVNILKVGEKGTALLLENNFIQNPQAEIKETTIAGNTVSSNGKTINESQREGVLIRLRTGRLINFSYIKGDESSYRFERRIKKSNPVIPPLVLVDSDGNGITSDPDSYKFEDM